MKKFIVNSSRFFVKRTLSSGTLKQSEENARKAAIMAKGLPKVKPIPGVKRIILVSSGKGGVGKSTVAVNVAAALKLNFPEKSIGILDTDVFGPSVPLMMNLSGTPALSEENNMLPLVNYGVKCMSLGFLTAKDAPVIWRGLMVMQALNKLLWQVFWDSLDYMIIDTPPGTGDTHLSLIQNIPIAGVILVTTPQTASLEVTRKGAGMFTKLNIPIIGIVENMTYIKCHSCSEQINLFGNGTSKLVKELNSEILVSFPLDINVNNSVDSGIPIVIAQKDGESGMLFKKLASKIVENYE